MAWLSITSETSSNSAVVYTDSYKEITEMVHKGSEWSDLKLWPLPIFLLHYSYFAAISDPGMIHT